MHCARCFCTPAPATLQAAQRGQKQAPATQADPDDPLRDHYGDSELVQSAVVTDRKWTDVLQLTPALAGQKVGAGKAGASCMWCARSSELGGERRLLQHCSAEHQGSGGLGPVAPRPGGM